MFKKVLEYAGEYRKTTYAAMLWMLVGVAMNVLPFLIVYQLITPLLGYGEMDVVGVIWRVIAIAICGILYAICYLRGLSLSHESAYHTLENIRISLQRKLEKQPLGTIQEKGVGVVKKMFIDDIENVEMLLAHALPEGTSNLAVPIFVFIVMFFVDWKLALLSLCSLPLGILAMGIMYKSGMSKMDAYYSSAQKMNNTIVEYINGMEVVKVFNRDGESYRSFENDVKKYRDFTFDWYKVCWPWMALYNSILPCVALFTLPIGAWFVLQGYSTLPNLVLVVCMSFGVGAPLLHSISFMSTLPQLNYKIESLEKMMGASPLKQNNNPFSGKSRSIIFDNVHFAYQDEEVLHGISISIEEGKFTALVGESGSGKSTLAKLMVHFYDVTSGSVKIGGQDVQDMSIEALNQEISYVSQEQFLFNMSLMENIRLGKLDATDEEVLAAAKKAQCNEFLERLENGIHTMAGDGGKQLSGGERQRISLARAILKNAPIVVLDEATAFMDPENEEKMNEAIAEVIKDKTVIVIAHRLHTIVNADKICVLNNGNLVAADTHIGLLKNCPEYQKLWLAAEGSAKWKVSAEKEVLA
ncbi:ABC transporter ATP-binding protein/permease [Clostridium sporogenes]|uniref:ABC transporter ATP-binding protein n=1 Tax=Clostridium sporogenes TaxID=1509 RepID=UPI00214A545F|nr:ABC transporter ATP-binding protein [Clostridium sporogenes]MCR1972602.1 ABC transporter ATP-binding protein/permease [Clostridium sporogenes]